MYPTNLTQALHTVLTVIQIENIYLVFIFVSPVNTRVCAVITAFCPVLLIKYYNLATCFHLVGFPQAIIRSTYNVSNPYRQENNATTFKGDKILNIPLTHVI